MEAMDHATLAGLVAAAIACLRIYQSVLSANEIKQVYSSDLRLIKGLANE